MKFYDFYENDQKMSKKRNFFQQFLANLCQKEYLAVFQTWIQESFYKNSISYTFYKHVCHKIPIKCQKILIFLPKMILKLSFDIKFGISV
jgi:hypothetical protein